MPAEMRMPEGNPFVEIATALFLEDLASKVGVAGLNNYLVSLARNLANTMPAEEYASWPEFLGSLVSGQSILATFEDVQPVTEHCMTTARSPFDRGWREYAKRVGSFAPVHKDVAGYYNAKVKPTAVTSVHIVLHTFRETAAARIRVAGKRLRYETLATAWVDGEVILAPADRLDGLVARAGITKTKLGMLLRNHADVWILESE